MAGTPMRRRSGGSMTLAGALTSPPPAAEVSTGTQVEVSTPSATPDIVQSPNGGRVDLPTRKPDASGIPNPAPGVLDSVDKATSDFASRLASNLAPQPPITVESFIRPRPEPELDLVACGLKLPRYIREAVRLAALTQHLREQEILARALRAYGPLQDVLTMTYAKARGDA